MKNILFLLLTEGVMVTENKDDVVEILQPEDFVVSGGYTVKDEVLFQIWIPGPKVVQDFGMTLDNVKITVDKGGNLDIVPIRPIALMGGFHCQNIFWKRRTELGPVTAIHEGDLDTPT